MPDMAQQTFSPDSGLGRGHDLGFENGVSKDAYRVDETQADWSDIGLEICFVHDGTDEIVCEPQAIKLLQGARRCAGAKRSQWATLVLRRSDAGQIGAIRQPPNRFKHDVSRHASQEMGLSLAKTALSHIVAVKTAIPHHQHPCVITGALADSLGEAFQRQARLAAQSASLSLPAMASGRLVSIREVSYVQAVFISLSRSEWLPRRQASRHPRQPQECV